MFGTKKRSSSSQYPKTCERVAEKFSQWQIDSLLLTVAFLPWTYFYWRLVITIGDIRYLHGAIYLHIMWGLIWLITSSKLIDSLKKWRRHQAELLVDVSTGKQMFPTPNANSMSSLDDPNTLIKLSRPIGKFRMVTTSIIAFVSFVIPLIRLL